MLIRVVGTLALATVFAFGIRWIVENIQLKKSKPTTKAKKEGQ